MAEISPAAIDAVLDVFHKASVDAEVNRTGVIPIDAVVAKALRAALPHLGLGAKPRPFTIELERDMRKWRVAITTPSVSDVSVGRWEHRGATKDEHGIAVYGESAAALRELAMTLLAAADQIDAGRPTVDREAA